MSLHPILTAPQSFWKFCQIPFSGLCFQAISSLDSVSKLFPSSSRFPIYNSDVPVFWRCVIKYRKQSLINPGQHLICLPLTSAIFLSLVPVPQLFGLAHKPPSPPPASAPQPLVLSPQPPGHLFCSNGSLLWGKDSSYKLSFSDLSFHSPKQFSFGNVGNPRSEKRQNIFKVTGLSAMELMHPTPLKCNRMWLAAAKTTSLRFSPFLNPLNDTLLVLE